MHTVVATTKQTRYWINLLRVSTTIYGLPSWVRSHYGMENFKVAQFALEQRGVGRGSIITGGSVHSCRVERGRTEISILEYFFFSKTFARLEDNGLLAVLSMSCTYSHYVIYTSPE